MLHSPQNFAPALPGNPRKTTSPGHCTWRILLVRDFSCAPIRRVLHSPQNFAPALPGNLYFRMAKKMLEGRSRGVTFKTGIANLSKTLKSGSWPFTSVGCRKRWERDTKQRGCKLGTTVLYGNFGAAVSSKDAVGISGAQKQLSEWVGAQPGEAQYNIRDTCEKNVHMQLFWNTRESKTPWHIDDTPGLLLTLRGEKKVFLKSVKWGNGSVGENIDYKSALEGLCNEPHVNVPSVCVSVPAGHYLVIPVHYWHCVVSAEDTMAVSYSIKGE